MHQADTPTTEQRLRDRIVELEQAAMAKDDFVSLAAHQLRTPATGVKQYLGLLMQGYVGELSDKQMEFLRTAYASNDRQLKLVEDLSRTAQIDAGRLRLRLAETDLAGMLSEVIEEQAVQVRARAQLVRRELPVKSRPIRLDADRIRMALENLLDNASKYTPSGGAIRVSLQDKPDSVDVAIHDKGVGIAPADQERIFEKFARVGNALSDHVTGSGLGLYWVKNIVELHGGSINVDSSPGHGSCFVVRLPRT